MNKIIDIKLTSIFSPTCQTLIHENDPHCVIHYKDKCLNSCKELLVVRLEGTLIAYGTFDLIEGDTLSINSLHFRNIIKDPALGEYWLSRHLTRYLRGTSYLDFLLAS